MKTWVSRAVLTVAVVVGFLSTTGSASAWWHRRTVTAYAALPSVPATTAGYAPVFVAPPVVAASPVVTAGYAPAVTYSAPITTYSAPVTTYYAPPVTTYYAPAVPLTTYYAPARPVIVRRPVLLVP
jgi:hypothetical protein